MCGIFLTRVTFRLIDEPDWRVTYALLTFDSRDNMSRRFYWNGNVCGFIAVAVLAELYCHKRKLRQTLIILQQTVVQQNYVIVLCSLSVNRMSLFSQMMKRNCWHIRNLNVIFYFQIKMRTKKEVVLQQLVADDPPILRIGQCKEKHIGNY